MPSRSAGRPGGGRLPPGLSVDGGVSGLGPLAVREFRLWRAEGSYASANDPRVLVGLGEATTVDHVRVIWPGGREEVWTDISVNRWLTLTEGTGQSQP